MRSSLLIRISILSNTILIAHSYVALNPFAAPPASAAELTRRRSSLQRWHFNLAAKDSGADESAAMAEENSRADPAAPLDWEQLASSAFTHDDRPIILFDGKCNLCNGGVNFALDHDPTANFRFVSLQSKVGQSLLIRCGRSPDDISSIVVCLKSGEAYQDSDAVLMVATGLQEPLPMVGHVGKVIPTFLRDGIFKFISTNRYRFLGSLAEEYDSCRIDWDGEFDDRFVPDP